MADTENLMSSYQAGYDTKVSMVNKAVDLEKKQSDIEEHKQQVALQKVDLMRSEFDKLGMLPQNMRQQRIENYSKQMANAAGINVDPGTWAMFANDSYRVPIADALSAMSEENDPKKRAELANHAVGSFSDPAAMLSGATQWAAEKKQQRVLEQIKHPTTQPALTEGQIQFDKKTADTLADFETAGGASKSNANVSQLEAARDAIKNDPDLVGKNIVGNLPDSVKSLIAPGTKGLEDAIGQIVSHSLKENFGARITQQEVNMYLKYAFDSRLSPEENIKRLDNTINLINNEFDAKKQALAYSKSTGGTMLGYPGPKPRAQAGPGSSVSLTPEAKSLIQKMKAVAPAKYGNLSDEDVYKAIQQNQAVQQAGSDPAAGKGGSVSSSLLKKGN